MAAAKAPKGGGRARPRYDALVDVSTRLFGEHGFEGTSVRMIADAMGVKSGSLYSHIKSKDEVLTRIVLTVADAFFEAAKVASESGDSPEERLRAMCQAHIEVIDQAGMAVRVYYDEWHKLNAKSRKEIAVLRKSYGDRFTKVVEEGVEDGSFGDIDVAWTVLVILSSCNWAVEWYSPKGPHGPAEIADRVMDVVMDGIRGNGKPAGPKPKPKRAKKKVAKGPKARKGS